MANPTPYIAIVFDGAPGPQGPRFVEVETADGRSIGLGEWVSRPNSPLWDLRITAEDFRRVFPDA